MNYVLISIGNVPDYLNYTINSILSVDKNAKIIIGSDQKIQNKNIELVDLKDIESAQTRKIKDLNIFRGTIFEGNPLWSTSLMRIFYLRDLQKNLRLTELVYFDNDILIYKPFDKVRRCMKNNRFNITPSNSRRLIFGYSAIYNISVFNKLCDLLESKLIKGTSSNWDFNNNTPPNEMDLLGMIYKDNSQLFNLLPNLPYQSDIIFDHLGYGMYLDGSHTYPRKFYSRRSVNFNDTVGVELYSKRIKVKFQNNEPVVIWNKKKYVLTNLHIHSKRFTRFLPSNYTTYT